VGGPGSSIIDSSTWSFRVGGKSYPSRSVRVSADYFKTLDISLLQGSLFSDRHPEDLGNTAIINEAAMRKLAISGPLGSRIRFPFCDRIPYQIVGVAKDFHLQGLESGIQPTVYRISNAHSGYQSGGAFLVRIGSGDIRKTLDRIKSSWKKIEPDFPIRYSFLGQDFERLSRS
jgi:putative ABC transport system permease protein